VATQALYFMNSPFVMDQARVAAQALLVEPGLDDRGRVERAYRVAAGADADGAGAQLALRFVATAMTPEQRANAWERFYQTLFACIDFRYGD